jgi:flagellar biosynthesis protein FlhF
MRIKKFTGTTLKEATNSMKDDLGAEAIILNTRKIPKGGLLNFLGKEEFEITAAIDERPLGVSNGEKRFAKELALATGVQRSTISPVENTFSGLQKVAKQFEHRAKEKAPTRTEISSLNGVAGFHDLKSEMESLRAVVQEVAIHLKYNRMPTLPEHLKNAYANLVEQDVDEGLAAELAQKVYRKLGEDLLGHKSEVQKCMLNAMADVFKTHQPEAATRKAKVIALVGPTGVGKTTTIAKLAAIHKLIHKQNVALISADTYRIGAIEQLKTFAAIADIPMEVAYKPSEMKGALHAFKDKDIIFVDTVGRSQRVRKEIAELGRFVSAANPREVHLVLSASANRKALEEILTNFKPAGPNRIIFSKLDEAATFGQLLNIAHSSKLPISYVTTGQSVPDDITMASNVHLAELVYTGEFIHG